MNYAIKIETLLPDTNGASNKYVLCFYPSNRMWTQTLFYKDTKIFKPCIFMNGEPTHWMYMPTILPI